MFLAEITVLTLEQLYSSPLSKLFDFPFLLSMFWFHLKKISWLTSEMYGNWLHTYT